MIIIANIIFYTLAALWVVQAETVPNKPIPVFFTYTDALIKSFSIMLLIYSLRRFQNQIKQLNNKDFFASEKLMRVHLYIFVTYLIAYLAFDLNTTF